MSKSETQEISSSVEKKYTSEVKQDTELQSVSDNYEQNLIKILDKISEDQKRLMKSRSELYVTYLTVMSDIVRRGFTGPYLGIDNAFGSAMPFKKMQEDMVKTYNDAHVIIENSIQLNNKLVLDMIDLAKASNRLYASAMINSNFFNFFSHTRPMT